MKLAEALNKRKNMLAQISNLCQRFCAAAIVPEGVVPDEDPVELYNAMVSMQGELYLLIVAINKTNNTVIVDEESGKTLMEAIAQRDVLMGQIRIFDNIVSQLTSRSKVAGKTSNRWGEETAAYAEVLAPGLQKVSYYIDTKDRMSKELRQLDVLIQAAGWTNDLLE